MDLTRAMIDKIIKNMPHHEAAELLVMFDEIEERKRVQMARDDFLAFIAAIDKQY